MVRAPSVVAVGVAPGGSTSVRIWMGASIP